MKQLLILITFLSLTTVAKAERWLVFIDRGGETHVLWMNERPFRGEGVTIFGPFPDRNAPTTVVGNAGQTVSIKEGNAKSIPAITTTTTTALVTKKTAVLVYVKGTEVRMVALSDNSNWKELLMANQSQGCENTKYQIMWVSKILKTPLTDLDLSVNGKPLSLPQKIASCPRGDILIGGEPIDFE